MRIAWFCLIHFLNPTSSHLPHYTLYLLVPALYMEEVPLTRSIPLLPVPIYFPASSCYPYTLILNVPSQISPLFQHTVLPLPDLFDYCLLFNLQGLTQP